MYLHLFAGKDLVNITNTPSISKKIALITTPARFFLNEDFW